MFASKVICFKIKIIVNLDIYYHLKYEIIKEN